MHPPPVRDHEENLMRTEYQSMATLAVVYEISFDEMAPPAGLPTGSWAGVIAVRVYTERTKTTRSSDGPS
jgi:hypothetical protein